MSALVDAELEDLLGLARLKQDMRYGILANELLGLDFLEVSW